MTTDVRLLHKAMDDTRQALAELIDPQRRSYMRERYDPDTGLASADGMTRHDAPSLLDQLREEVAASGGGRGGRRRSAPIPIAADALDLLNAVTVGAGELVILAGVSTTGLSIETGLRAVVAAAAAWTDLEAVHGVRLALTGWVRGIRDLLDPPKRLYLAAPCPRCEVSMVWRRDNTIGEDVQQPALQVDGQTGCTCVACGAHWAPELFEHLAAVLGCVPLPGAEGNGETAA